MTITARDELLHLVEGLTQAECERALTLLAPLTEPHCPLCYEARIDRLAWQEDEQHVCCETCGTVFDPRRKMT